MVKYNSFTLFCWCYYGRCSQIFMSPFLDVLRMFMSTVPFLPQLKFGILCLHNYFLWPRSKAYDLKLIGRFYFVFFFSNSMPCSDGAALLCCERHLNNLSPGNVLQFVELLVLSLNKSKDSSCDFSVVPEWTINAQLIIFKIRLITIIFLLRCIWDISRVLGLMNAN